MNSISRLQWAMRPSTLKSVRLKMGEGIAGWVARHGEPLIVPDVYNDPRFAKRIDEMTKWKTRSIICMPLKSRQRVLGVIQLINVGMSQIEENEMFFLQALCDYAAIAIENAGRSRRFRNSRSRTTAPDSTMPDIFIRRSSRGLPLGAFRIRVHRVVHRPGSLQEVNDTYGHLIGSRLLAEIGYAVKSHLRLIDYAFRYGGDEFVILLPQTSKESATVVARTLAGILPQNDVAQGRGIEPECARQHWAGDLSRRMQERAGDHSAGGRDDVRGEELNSGQYWDCVAGVDRSRKGFAFLLIETFVLRRTTLSANMSLNIKNKEAHKLARQLARLTGESVRPKPLPKRSANDLSKCRANMPQSFLIASWKSAVTARRVSKSGIARENIANFCITRKGCRNDSRYLGVDSPTSLAVKESRPASRSRSRSKAADRSVRATRSIVRIGK